MSPIDECELVSLNFNDCFDKSFDSKYGPSASASASVKTSKFTCHELLLRVCNDHLFKEDVKIKLTEYTSQNTNSEIYLTGQWKSKFLDAYIAQMKEYLSHITPCDDKSSSYVCYVVDCTFDLEGIDNIDIVDPYFVPIFRFDSQCEEYAVQLDTYPDNDILSMAIAGSESIEKYGETGFVAGLLLHFNWDKFNY
jgi:hypothetical protein